VGLANAEVIKSSVLRWHRLVGLILSPLFDLLGYLTQVEIDLSMKEQFLDIVVVRRGDKPTDFSRLPKVYWEAFGELNLHNLISFKSYSESFNAESLEEFFGHLTNYRKQYEVDSDDINLYAIVYHYPRDLFRAYEGSDFLKTIKERNGD
jgi:hypothetical protein